MRGRGAGPSPSALCSSMPPAPQPRGLLFFFEEWVTQRAALPHQGWCSRERVLGPVQPSARSLCFPFPRLRAFHIPIDNVSGTFRH